MRPQVGKCRCKAFIFESTEAPETGQIRMAGRFLAKRRQSEEKPSRGTSKNIEHDACHSKTTKIFRPSLKIATARDDSLRPSPNFTKNVKLSSGSLHGLRGFTIFRVRNYMGKPFHSMEFKRNRRTRVTHLGKVSVGWKG